MARIAVGHRHALALHRLSRLVAGREGVAGEKGGVKACNGAPPPLKYIAFVGA